MQQAEVEPLQFQMHAIYEMFTCRSVLEIRRNKANSPNRGRNHIMLRIIIKVNIFGYPLTNCKRVEMMIFLVKFGEVL